MAAVDEGLTHAQRGLRESYLYDRRHQYALSTWKL